MTLTVSVAVQTHPKRADLAAPLLAELAAQGADVELAVDPAPLGLPSPWRTYRHALERTPSWATHRLVVQDDVVVCPGFVPAMQAALSAIPDRHVTFYVGGAPQDSAQAVLSACAQDLPWARIGTHRWVPCIALAWPVETIPGALAWVDAQNYPETFRGDDEIVGRVCTALHYDVVATVPCLVQHPDDVPSLIGLRAWNGKDPARVACCYIEDCDPACIDWTLTP